MTRSEKSEQPMQGAQHPFIKEYARAHNINLSIFFKIVCETLDQDPKSKLYKCKPCSRDGSSSSGRGSGSGSSSSSSSSSRSAAVAVAVAVAVVVAGTEG